MHSKGSRCLHLWNQSFPPCTIDHQHDGLSLGGVREDVHNLFHHSWNVWEFTQAKLEGEVRPKPSPLGPLARVSRYRSGGWWGREATSILNRTPGEFDTLVPTPKSLLEPRKLCPGHTIRVVRFGKFHCALLRVRAGEGAPEL